MPIGTSLSLADRTRFPHTFFFDGMERTSEVRNGRAVFRIPVSVQHNNAAGHPRIFDGSVTVAVGGLMEVVNLDIELQLAAQHRNTALAPSNHTVNLRLGIINEAFGLGFDFEHFNDNIGASTEVHTYFFPATPENWTGVCRGNIEESSHATLVRNISATPLNPAARAAFNLFDLLRFYNAGGMQIEIGNGSFGTSAIDGFTVEEPIIHSTGTPVIEPLILTNREFTFRDLAIPGRFLYRITIDSVGAYGHAVLYLQVIYRNSIVDLTVADDTVEVNYHFDAFMLNPAVSTGITTQGNAITRVPAVLGASTAIPVNYNQRVFTNIFVPRGNSMRMLIRHPQLEAPPGTPVWFFDYNIKEELGITGNSYAELSAALSQNLDLALFAQNSAGLISINRCLFAHAYQNGASRAFDQVTVRFTTRQLFNGGIDFGHGLEVHCNESGDIAEYPHQFGVRLCQRIRGIHTVSVEASVQLRAFRLFDRIAFFDIHNSNELPSSIERPRLSNLSVYASGIINVDGAGNDDEVIVGNLSSAFSALLTDSLEDITILDSNVITYQGGGTFFIEDSSYLQTSLRVAANRESAHSLLLTINLIDANLIPITNIEIVDNSDAVLTNVPYTLLVNSQDLNARVGTLRVRVTYNVEDMSGAAYQYQPARLDIVSGNDIATIITPLSGGNNIAFANTVDRNTIPQGASTVTRYFTMYLRALPNIAEARSEVRLISADGIFSQSFPIRVSSISDAIRVRNLRDSTQGQLDSVILTLNASHTSSDQPIRVVYIHQERSSGIQNLTNNFNYTVEWYDNTRPANDRYVAMPNIGDVFFLDGIIQITRGQRWTDGVQAFEIRSVGSNTLENLRIRFVQENFAPSGIGSAANPIADNARQISNVLTIRVETEVTDLDFAPEDLFNGELPIIVAPAQNHESFAAFRFNHGGTAPSNQTINNLILTLQVMRRSDNAVITNFPVEFSIIENNRRLRAFVAAGNLAALQSRAVSDESYFIRVRAYNAGSGTAVYTTVDLYLATSEFRVEVRTIRCVNGGLTQNVAAGTNDISIFAGGATPQVAVYAAAVNTWTQSDLCLDKFAIEFNFNQTGLTGSNGFGAVTDNRAILTIPAAAAQFTLSLSANHVGSATVALSAVINVTTFNRTAAFEIDETQLPKITGTAPNHALTLVRNASTDIGAEIDLKDYLTALGPVIGSNRVNPAVNTFTVSVQGAAVSVSGTQLTANSVGSATVTIRANAHAMDIAAQYYIELVVTVVNLTLSVPTQGIVTLGERTDFEIPYSLTGGTVPFTNHDITVSMRETNLSNRRFNKGDGSHHNQTNSSYVFDIGSMNSFVSSISFTMEYNIDGVEFTAVHVREFRLFSAAIQAELAGTPVTGQAGAGNYTVDILRGLSANVVLSSAAQAQFNRLQGIYAGASQTVVSNSASIASVSGNALVFTGVTGDFTATLTLSIAGQTIAFPIYVGLQLAITVTHSGLVQLYFNTGTSVGTSTRLNSATPSFALDQAYQDGISLFAMVWRDEGFTVNASDFDFFISTTAFNMGAVGEVTFNGRTYFYVELTAHRAVLPSESVQIRVDLRLTTPAVQVFTDIRNITVTAVEFGITLGDLTLTAGQTHNLDLNPPTGFVNDNGRIAASFSWLRNNAPTNFLGIASNGVITVGTQIPYTSSTVNVAASFTITSGVWTGISVTYHFIVTISSSVRPTIQFAGQPAVSRHHTVVLDRGEGGGRIVDDIQSRLSINPGTGGMASISWVAIAYHYIPYIQIMRPQSHTVSLPREMLSVTLRITVSITGGHWAGYTNDSFTITLEVLPLLNMPQPTGLTAVNNAAVSGTTNTLTSTQFITAGEYLLLGMTIDPKFTSGAYVAHATTAFNIRRTSDTVRSSSIVGLGWIEERANGFFFQSDERGQGGFVTIYGSIRITQGPFAGREVSRTINIAVLGIALADHTAANWATDSGGTIFVLSGQSFNLSSALVGWNPPQAGNRVFGNYPIWGGAGQSATVSTTMESGLPFGINMSGTQIFIPRGTHVQGENPIDPLNLGNVITMTITVQVGLTTLTFHRALNLSVLPETMPPISLGTTLYSIAGTNPIARVGGTAILAEGDQILFRAQNVSGVQLFRLLLTETSGSGREEAISINPADLSDGSDYVIPFTIPASFVGSWSVRIEATILGHTITSAPYLFNVAAPSIANHISRTTTQVVPTGFVDLILNHPNSVRMVVEIGGGLVVESVSVFGQGLQTGWSFVSGILIHTFTAATTGNITIRLRQEAATPSGISNINATLFTSHNNFATPFRFVASTNIWLLDSSDITGFVPSLTTRRAAMNSSIFLALDHTRLNYGYMGLSGASYQFVDGEGGAQISNPALLLQRQVGAGVMVTPQGNPNWFINQWIRLSYTIMGVAVTRYAQVEFHPPPVFEAARQQSNSRDINRIRISDTTNSVDLSQIDVIVTIAGTGIVQAEFVSYISAVDGNGYFDFKPIFRQGRVNQLAFRIVITVRDEDSIFYGVPFTITTPTITIADEGLVSPRYTLSGLPTTGSPSPYDRHSGMLTVHNAENSTVAITLGDSAQSAYFAGGFNPTGNVWSFRFNTNPNPRSVRVYFTVTINAGALYGTQFVYFIIINAPRLEQPNFIAERIGNENRVQIRETTGIALSQVTAVVSFVGTNQNQFVLETTFAIDANGRFSFTPIFRQGRENTIRFEIRFTILDPYSGFFNQQFLIITPIIAIADEGLVSPRYTLSSIPTTGAERHSGTLTVHNAANSTVSFALEVPAQSAYFASFSPLGNVLSFRFNPSENVRSVRILFTVTITATQEQFIYFITITPSPIAPPNFTAQAPTRSNAGLTTVVTGVLDETAISATDFVVHSVTVISGQAYILGTLTLVGNSFTFRPNFIQAFGRSNIVIFEITVQMLSDGRTFVIQPRQSVNLNLHLPQPSISIAVNQNHTAPTLAQRLAGGFTVTNLPVNATTAFSVAVGTVGVNSSLASFDTASGDFVWNRLTQAREVRVTIDITYNGFVFTFIEYIQNFVLPPPSFERDTDTSGQIIISASLGDTTQANHLVLMLVSGHITYVVVSGSRYISNIVLVFAGGNLTMSYTPHYFFDGVNAVRFRFTFRNNFYFSQDFIFYNDIVIPRPINPIVTITENADNFLAGSINVTGAGILSVEFINRDNITFAAWNVLGNNLNFEFNLSAQRQQARITIIMSLSNGRTATYQAVLVQEPVLPFFDVRLLNQTVSGGTIHLTPQNVVAIGNVSFEFRTITENCHTFLGGAFNILRPNTWTPFTVTPSLGAFAFNFTTVSRPMVGNIAIEMRMLVDGIVAEANQTIHLFVAAAAPILVVGNPIATATGFDVTVSVRTAAHENFALNFGLAESIILSGHALVDGAIQTTAIMSGGITTGIRFSVRTLTSPVAADIRLFLSVTTMQQQTMGGMQSFTVSPLFNNLAVVRTTSEPYHRMYALRNGVAAVTIPSYWTVEFSRVQTGAAGIISTRIDQITGEFSWQFHSNTSARANYSIRARIYIGGNFAATIERTGGYIEWVNPIGSFSTAQVAVSGTMDARRINLNVAASVNSAIVPYWQIVPSLTTATRVGVPTAGIDNINQATGHVGMVFGILGTNSNPIVVTLVFDLGPNFLQRYSRVLTISVTTSNIPSFVGPTGP